MSNPTPAEPICDICKEELAAWTISWPDTNDEATVLLCNTCPPPFAATSHEHYRGASAGLYGALSRCDFSWDLFK